MGPAQVSKSTTGPDSPNAHHSPQWQGLFLVQGLLGPIWPLITQQAARSLTAILSLVFGSSYLSYTRIGMKWGHSAAC